MTHREHNQSCIPRRSFNSTSIALPLAIVFVLAIGAARSAQAQTFTVLDSISGAVGGEPYSGVTMDRAGNLYGTTFLGGGYGTAYELVHTASGYTAEPIWVFTAGADGAGPSARLILGPGGNLYGTTLGGGTGDCRDYSYGGCGTVFELNKDTHKQTVLYRFKGGSDGAAPYSEVVFDSAGNLYGAASEGGGGAKCSVGCGVVYKLTPSKSGWRESILYRFSGRNDGIAPSSPLIFDRAGNLYGTAQGGGAHGWGTVFELTHSGSRWVQKTLYGFGGDSDGTSPVAGVIFDRAGNLYGATTSFGGQGAGTAFELTPSKGHWTLNLIQSFASHGQSDGGPWGTLIMDRAGNLYGTTYQDGSFGYGSVFKLARTAKGWTYTSLHDFTSHDDGWTSFSNLIFDAKGNLYGTAILGGAGGVGTVFEITPK
jgi:uncharacterized repeat protein (TIGR03803 family)